MASRVSFSDRCLNTFYQDVQVLKRDMTYVANKFVASEESSKMCCIALRAFSFLGAGYGVMTALKSVPLLLTLSPISAVVTLACGALITAFFQDLFTLSQKMELATVDGSKHVTTKNYTKDTLLRPVWDFLIEVKYAHE